MEKRNCGACAFWNYAIDPYTGKTLTDQPLVCKLTPNCVYKHGNDWCGSQTPRKKMEGGSDGKR